MYDLLGSCSHVKSQVNKSCVVLKIVYCAVVDPEFEEQVAVKVFVGRIPSGHIISHVIYEVVYRQVVKHDSRNSYVVSVIK